MKCILLNGSRTDDVEIDNLYQSIIEELMSRGWDASSHVLRNIDIAPCQGCFDCWVKTPGVCRINDISRDITGEMVHGQLIIHFTPITFGGYSSEIKKAIDRFIPVLLPFFQNVKGEIHHKFRYEKRPSILVIGYLEQSDEEEEITFKTLVSRNSHNMGAPIHEALIYAKGQVTSDFLTEFTQILSEVENLA